MAGMKPCFFKTPESFRAWLERNHDQAEELLVGFYKKGSRKGSITWPESVDQALCFGWIDGVRRRIDDESYSIRFTPRRKGSVWSRKNIERATELRDLGLMHPAGVQAFESRIEGRSQIYSYENPEQELGSEGEKRFRTNREAWDWFQKQPPSYRRVAIYWVVSAKREATRQRRLDRLIDDSSQQRRLAQYTLESRRK